MPIVGALVQIDPLANQEVQISLSMLPDVTVHAFDMPGKMAMIIERDDLNQVHSLLKETVENTNGVLAIYPVYTYLGDDLETIEVIDIGEDIGKEIEDLMSNIAER